MAVFAKAIFKIKERGVLPPEALDADVRKYVIDELRNKGVVIEEVLSTL
ncbi:hypothetical protein HZB03_02860 [Candidatus Woesearchaeota archaeon]|nr:hypothetical protein [Candidatus Woesearchaeota archaeon]